MKRFLARLEGFCGCCGRGRFTRLRYPSCVDANGRFDRVTHAAFCRYESAYLCRKCDRASYGVDA